MASFWSRRRETAGRRLLWKSAVRRRRVGRIPARRGAARVQGLSNSGSTAEISAIVSETQMNSGSTL